MRRTVSDGKEYTVSSLILADYSTGTLILAVIIALVAGVVAALVILHLVGNAAVHKAKDEAKRLLQTAELDAKLITEKAEVEAEKRVIERREQAEADIQSIRNELKETERRLDKREDRLEKKQEALGLKESELARVSTALAQREEAIAAREKDAEDLFRKRKEELLRAAHMSEEEAKKAVLKQIEEDCRLEAAQVSRRILDDAEQEAKERAGEITIQAIQRYAGETTSESTIRAVPIPSDDVKGRIIGREGRNIRAFERAAGVDVIVDDTPGVIVVSCFDKVRQTIAAEALQRLVTDNRVHPSRIEEIIEQVRTEVQERIVKYGKDAVLEVKLRGLHPKIVEAMGRLAFRTSFGQNVLRHSIEVAYFAQLIADQLGFDGRLARRCGFLHDIGKAMDHEQEGGHPRIGMDFARQHGEKEIVLNAIGGHHADIPATSFYTPIVMAADAISSARPGARRESMEKYIQRLEQLQEIALSYPGVNEAHAVQAGREVRVMVDARRVDDAVAHMIARDIANRVSDEMTFPGEIKVTVLRETRAIELAR
ncbi:MAG TPA: ribonuclease Y [Phycisphaeraceae bacterium]|nr:ribonuclease Y [Phycisphaeraceae bacterium]